MAWGCILEVDYSYLEKWEQITMDVVVGLPTIVGGYESIWVVFDRVTKFAHFIPIRVKYITKKLAELYQSNYATTWSSCFY